MMQNNIDDDDCFIEEKEFDDEMSESYSPNKWDRYLCNVQHSRKRENREVGSNLDENLSLLITKYLEYFCTKSENSSLDNFKEIFKLDFLKTIEERVSIYKSDASDGLKSLEG